MLGCFPYINQFEDNIDVESVDFFLILPPPWRIFCFFGCPGFHLSHEMRVQLDYTSHTCINLHEYNDESRYSLTEILQEKTLTAPG